MKYKNQVQGNGKERAELNRLGRAEVILVADCRREKFDRATRQSTELEAGYQV
jgi:hypothetical protein